MLHAQSHLKHTVTLHFNKTFMDKLSNAYFKFKTQIKRKWLHLHKLYTPQFFQTLDDENGKISIISQDRCRCSPFSEAWHLVKGTNFLNPRGSNKSESSSKRRNLPPRKATDFACSARNIDTSEFFSWRTQDASGWDEVVVVITQGGWYIERSTLQPSLTDCRH